jgi:hypothetical protein
MKERPNSQTEKNLQFNAIHMFRFKSKLIFQSAETLPHNLLASQIWPHRTVLILTSSVGTVNYPIVKLLKYDVHNSMNIKIWLVCESRQCAKIKVKLSLCLTPWRRMGSGCVGPHFLDLGTSWRRVVSFTPLPLYPRGKSPRYPLDRRLGGPQSRSGRFGKEKILDPTVIRTPTPRSSSP